MKIDKDIFDKTAELAKIKFTKEEAREIMEEVETILTRFDNASNEFINIESETELGLLGLNKLGYLKEIELRKDKVEKFEYKEKLFPVERRMQGNYIAIPRILS